ETRRRDDGQDLVERLAGRELAFYQLDLALDRTKRRDDVYLDPLGARRIPQFAPGTGRGRDQHVTTAVPPDFGEFECLRLLEFLQAARGDSRRLYPEAHQGLEGLCTVPHPTVPPAAILT